MGLKPFCSFLLVAALTGCLIDSRSPGTNNLPGDPVVPSDSIVSVDGLAPIDTIVQVDSLILIDSAIFRDGPKMNYGVKIDGGTFSIYGDTLVLVADVAYRKYCDGNAFEAPIDESRLVDSSLFFVKGNIFGRYGYRVADTLESGAVVRKYIRHHRVGLGKGIEGAWRFDELNLEVISGTPSTAEQEIYAINSSWYGSRLKHLIFEFRKGKFTVYSNENTADVFLVKWNTEWVSDLKDESGKNRTHSDSANFDIAVRKVDFQTVELKGWKTQETVILKISPEGNLNYTSNNPNNPAHNYLSNPVSCPNKKKPDWYNEFLEENEK